jgi:hypothetical protein
MFAFLLCVRIMMNEGKINQVEKQAFHQWNCLPKGLLCCGSERTVWMERAGRT